MQYFVYILKSIKDSKFYIGQTNNITNRLSRHNNGEVTATRNRKPLVLVHKEEYSNRKESMAREKYLKSLKSHEYIENNIIAKR